MNYHLDEDQSPWTARTARQRHDLDVTSSHELSLDRTLDDEQLLLAGVLIVPRSMPTDAYERIARALAWYHSLYPDRVPPYFVSYLQDPPDGWP